MIDQTNFETWFFMYADNELSADERLQVEEFVRSNPFCHPHFELINQIKFQPEKIVFADKESLYSEQIQLQDFHLEPDMSIVYPHKSELYKKGSPRKINNYFSLSIAASVVLLVGLLILFKDDAADVKQETPINNDQVFVKPPIQSNKSSISSVTPVIQKTQTKLVKSTVSREVDKGVDSKTSSEMVLVESVIQPSTEEAIVIAPPVQSNLSEEVLLAAASRMASSAQSEESTSTINTEMFIEASVKDKEKGRLRGLVRKLSRQIFRENENVDQEKMIQVASFVIPVSNKK